MIHEGLGPGFHLSSAETDFLWLEEEQEDEGKPILVNDIDLGIVAAGAGGSESCSK